ncbi:MAG: TIGR04255 family protein [Gemmatimonadaceae bacterium]
MATASIRQQRTLESLTRRIYKRPPVVEALVDIHVTSTLQQSSASSLRTLLDSAETRYQEAQELRTGNFAFDAATWATSSTPMELEGYRFASVDGTEVVQVRHRSLTVSSLAPYRGWEALLKATEAHWNRFRAVAHAITVTRIAVRYINRLSLPYQGVPLAEYLHVVPAIGDSLPNRIGQFLLRLEIVNPGDPGTRLIITEGRELNPDPARIFIVLDLDVSRPVEIEPGDSATLFRSIEDLHTLGNDAFENSITDKARALFE